MCGIVGYIGQREAAPIVLRGLSRLEYRGYDSAGLAIGTARGFVTRKLAGRVAALRDSMERLPVHGEAGIGHTRWATHGAPTERNAHPHVDCHERIALVHNGIIENAPGDTLEARVIAGLEHVVGTYGLAVISADDRDKIVVARQGSPVVLGVGEDEFFVASDASAIVEHTRSVVYLDDGDIAVLRPTEYFVLDRESHVQLREVADVPWDLEAIELGGHPHFMLKEIREQSETVHSTLRGRLVFEEGAARLNGLNLSSEGSAGIRRIEIVACGTSWHAGLVGRHIIEELTQIPVAVEYASEYRYRHHLRSPGTLTIAISQS